MGQYWQLLNIDAQSSESLGKLGESFFTHWRDLARRLAEPVLEELPPLKNGSMRDTKRVLVAGAAFGRFSLAIELIHIIFEEIDDVQDAIMLGLTHDTLMTIGWRHIRALVLQAMAPWAGGRIICVGDYADDLPEGLISKAEQEELLALYSESDSDEQEPGTTPTEPFNLHRVSSESFGDVTDHFTIDYERLWGLPSKEQQIFQQIMETKYGWENGWVLMNLSKMQYVTSNAASMILRSIDPTDGCCFGQLILSRICWSSDNQTHIDFDGPLNRGVWAGDRFRIVTTDVFKTRTAGQEGWDDVSVEATKWLKAILRSEPGGSIGSSDDSDDEGSDDNDDEGSDN